VVVVVVVRSRARGGFSLEVPPSPFFSFQISA
jgi:hypothetical protein